MSIHPTLPAVCFSTCKHMCILIIKTWAGKCPSAYSFHCLPDTSYTIKWTHFHYCLSSCGYECRTRSCQNHLNKWKSITEIRAIRLLCCQWRISLCMVWKLIEGSRMADCLSMKTCTTFPTVSSSFRCLLFRKLFTAMDLPRKPR